ncbi:MAG: ATP synthase F1 subunit delta [Lachnospiraceae bacterium]|nr:ATP synthase F1 subunit delta [Lachnospiraceae bacterium]
MAKIVSKSYGDALFDLSLEKSRIDELYEEAKVILEVFKENEELMKFLTHPKISKDEKIAFAENVFKGRVSDDLVGFLVILIKKDRQSEIKNVFDYFIGRVKEYKKIGIVYVTSATELSGEQKDKLIDRLVSTTEYEKFETHYTVDKEILGGMIIRIGDRVVDSSIRTKINSLSKDLYKIQLT